MGRDAVGRGVVVVRHADAVTIADFFSGADNWEFLEAAVSLCLLGAELNLEVAVVGGLEVGVHGHNLN